MKVYVDGKLYDTEETPVILVFENDSKRAVVAENIKHMIPGARFYATYPEGYPVKLIEDMVEAIKASEPLGS
jgi:hypothetical protein